MSPPVSKIVVQKKGRTGPVTNGADVQPQLAATAPVESPAATSPQEAAAELSDVAGSDDKAASQIEQAPVNGEAESSFDHISASCGKTGTGQRDELNVVCGPTDNVVSEVAPNDQVVLPMTGIKSGSSSGVPTLEDAYEACRTVRTISGKMQHTRWNKRAYEMVPRAIAFVDAYNNEPDAYAKTCKILKSEKRRVPKIENVKVHLIAVQMCMEPPNFGDRSDTKRRKAEQTEWSRFSKVVLAAANEGISPALSHAWLDKRTLNEILAKARTPAGNEGSQGGRPVPALLKKHKHLAEAFAQGEGRNFEKASARLEEILAALDAEIAALTEADAQSPSQELGA